MGVRITMHAVDVPRFVEFLEQPLGAVLQYHADHYVDRDQRLWFTDAPYGAHTYIASSDDQVIKFEDGQRSSLPEEKWTQIDFLNTTARQYLDGGSPYDLNRLLDSLATIAPADFVETITSGHRRWWIGSLLAYTASASEVSKPESDRLTELLRRVLGRYDCGWPLPEIMSNMNERDFPVIPQADPDLSMAVWSCEETRFVTGVLRRIRNPNPRFESPPGRVGVAPEAEDDWNDWVHEMIQQILRIDEVEFEDMRIVAFVD